MSPNKSRSYSCSAASPSQGIKIKIRRVETRRELVDSVERLRKRLAFKMATKECYMIGCQLSFKGDNEADANAKVLDHIIRVHEQNGAEERRIYLANQQSVIIDGQLAKLREAKALGMDTEMFMNMTGMKNGGLAGTGEGRVSKVEFPEWVKLGTRS